MQRTGREKVTEKYTLLLNVDGKERMGIDLEGTRWY
jgi:hypothetical protein